jgi:phage major head subunit gpT-like protein
MIINQPNLDALRTGFSLIFSNAYAKADGPDVNWWKEVTTEVPGISKTNTYGWLAQQLKMRKWKGPRLVRNLAERTKVIATEPFEATVGVMEEDLEDDNLGIYQAQLIPQLAVATLKHPGILLRDLIQSNPTTFDGKALFADDHPTYDEAGDTYDNNFGLALTADNLFAVWSAMVAYKGEDGEPLGLLPNKLFVPPQLKKKALEITQSSAITQIVMNVAAAENVAAAAASNVMQDWVQVVTVPQFANQATTWYLGDTTTGIMPFLRVLRRAARFVSLTSMATSDHVFNTREYLYGVDLKDAMSETLPFLLAKSVG